MKLSFEYGAEQGLYTAYAVDGKLRVFVGGVRKVPPRIMRRGFVATDPEGVSNEKVFPSRAAAGQWLVLRHKERQIEKS